MESQSSLYHERQVRELCAVHALNNLFQDRLFQKHDLDGICTELSPDEWINPHRSILGLGNYDVNVLMKALLTKGCDMEWFDKRKDPTTIIPIDDDNTTGNDEEDSGSPSGGGVLGFILNVPSEYKIGFVSLPLQRRHWISIRRVGSAYFSFDSKLKDPVKIGTEDDLVNHLRVQLECKSTELFIVKRISTTSTTAE